MKEFITLPEERVKVVENADICVIGGSCTGLFAALRASKLGARVVIVERQNMFGGVATLGLVGMWHTFFDIHKEKQIIGGLTYEACERLEKYGAISDFRDPEDSTKGIRFNPEYLTLELDAMASEASNLTTYFHTSFSAAVMKSPGTIDSVILEGRGERFAIRAKYFIDASGDGFLCRSAGTEMYQHPAPQPATSCMRFANWDKLPDFDLRALIKANREEFPDLPCGYYWGMYSHGTPVYMLAGTRIIDGNTLDASSITRAEMEARRQIRALDLMLRKKFPEASISLQALPSMIGIRDGLHIKSDKQLSGTELLSGESCLDAIANGTYPVDIHSNSDDGITFRYLTGEERIYRTGKTVESRRWLPEGTSLPFYQVPLRTLIPHNAVNFIAAGRMIDAAPDAFGAVRVMVNLNQCGEAAGVAAALALQNNCTMKEVQPSAVRKTLAAGGSIVI
jgi:FAD dependent oxidoreductase